MYELTIISWGIIILHGEGKGRIMKRLLLFDLDGTLLTSEKVISEKTFAALMKAREMGYLIGISTSRSVKNSLSFTDRLVPDIIIASGGALVKAGNDTVFEQELSVEETRRIIDISREILGEDCEITVDTAEDHFANYGDKYSTLEKTWGGDIYSDFRDWREPSLKVCVRIVDDDAAGRIRDRLPDCDCIRFTDEYWYKFTKKNITKETAILRISEILGIAIADITAFGDDLADIGMLKLCGTGIAMGNAREEVKKAADLVIGTNDADGIAEYINTGRCF